MATDTNNLPTADYRDSADSNWDEAGLGGSVYWGLRVDYKHGELSKGRPGYLDANGVPFDTGKPYVVVDRTAQFRHFEKFDDGRVRPLFIPKNPRKTFDEQRPELGDSDRSKWPPGYKGQGLQDPWTPIWVLQLLDLETGQYYSLQLDTFHSRRSAEELLAHAVRVQRQHPGMVPLIMLGWQACKIFGNDNDRPQFLTGIRWQRNPLELNGGGQPQLEVPKTAQIEHQPTVPVEDSKVASIQADPQLAQAEKPAKVAPKSKATKPHPMQPDPDDSLADLLQDQNPY